jgi:hypothetical protein
MWFGCLAVLATLLFDPTIQQVIVVEVRSALVDESRQLSGATKWSAADISTTFDGLLRCE